MSRESVVFGVAGVFFGLLVGWIIGSQTARGRVDPLPDTRAQAAETTGTQAAPGLDERRVAALRASAAENAADAAPRVELGALYFQAERFSDAARWYEEALSLDPKNVNARTDLGIAYYYMNQPDRALEQFERSLAIDPDHTKTLLNLGIVRAFGKQDLEGAAGAWRRVLEIAPDSPEARMARQGLQGLRSAHPDVAPEAAPSGR